MTRWAQPPSALQVAWDAVSRLDDQLAESRRDNAALRAEAATPRAIVAVLRKHTIIRLDRAVAAERALAALQTPPTVGWRETLPTPEEKP